MFGHKLRVESKGRLSTSTQVTSHRSPAATNIPGSPIVVSFHPVYLLLNEIECRVLGSLVEKEITTPEYYPLSLNALVNACNQNPTANPP